MKTLLLPLLALCTTSLAAESPWFRIRVVDDATGRGVPLVELRTVNQAAWYTDSAGLVAFNEPGLMDRRVWFSVRSHGYAYPKDGFGNAGLVLTPQAGGRAEIKLKRLNVAERMYRITGQGIYRDSVLLGEPAPLREPALNGEVLGQDSVQRALYAGKIFWFWGDTLRARYPLGHFWMSGATSLPPGQGGLSPAQGVDLTYVVDGEGFSRPMWERPAEGLIWSDGFLVAKDASGREHLVAHHARMKDLGKKLGQGLSEYDDAASRFRIMQDIPLSETWRFPAGHPLTADGYVLFPNPWPTVRVRPGYEAVTNSDAYEAFTWTEPAGWHWSAQGEPMTSKQEASLIKQGRLPADQARFQPRDAESGKPVSVHAGSVNWNAYRKKYILIAVEQGGSSSFLGEVWYGEADAPTGPWRKLRKVVTHDKYSFYNPVHHAFFDEDGGRLIYFEGTYAETFAGAPFPTPRYDYNQVMYRLDLSDPRLQVVQ